jgi:AraC-like DNA-binding protein
MQCLEIVTGGRGWVEIEGEWVEVTPGALLWHIPGDYTIGRSQFDNPYSCLAVRFYHDEITERPVPHLTYWEDLEEVHRFTREISRLHSADGFNSLVLLQYIISRVQFEAERFMHGQREDKLPVGLRRAVQLLDEGYSKPLRIQQLAAVAGWSVPHLHDMFKQHLGVTPHQALIRRRIQIARELLVATNEPVKSVAHRCGFPTAAAFCSQFKKLTKRSPTEFRQR